MYQNLNLRGDLDDEQRESVLCGLGLAFESGGFVPRAVATLEQVLQKTNDHEVALEALIRLLPTQGDFERTLVLRRRWAKRPHGERDRSAEATLLVRIARTRIAQGRDDMARKVARRALRLDAHEADAHLLLAEIEANRKRPKAVVSHLVSALEVAPERADSILPVLQPAWADGAGRRGDWVTFLRGVAQRHSDEPAFVEALARAHVEREEEDEALEVLRAGLVRWPAETRLRMREGRILLRGGRYDDALSAYEGLLDQLEKQQASGAEDA